MNVSVHFLSYETKIETKKKKKIQNKKKKTPQHYVNHHFHYQETGWMPRHIVAKDESENILGVVPLYLKRFIIYHSVQLVNLLDSPI